MGKMARKQGNSGLILILALLSLFIILSFGVSDTPFPGYFEINPSCIQSLTCGQGQNITVNGTGILNLLASPANGAADGLVTGVTVNVTWNTTTDGTAPYPLNSSVWKKNSTGTFLLGENSTVSGFHFVQIGPFAYSSTTCPSLGCEISLIVSSCNTTTSVCVNSSNENSTFSIVVASAVTNLTSSPASPRTGDPITLSWNTISPMNSTVSWMYGSSSNSTYSSAHSIVPGAFNYSEDPNFTIISCASGGLCETYVRQVSILKSASSVSFSSTAPSTNITASWTTHNNSNSTLFFSLNGGAVQNVTDSAFSSSHAVPLGSYSAGDSIVYYLRSCLDPNNCETTQNESITIAIPPTTTTISGGGGGGGSGGGGSSGGFGGGFGTTTTSIPIPAGSEYTYKSLPAGLPASFPVNGSTQAITLVTFTYETYVPNATLVFTRILSIGAISPPPGTLYQYINLTHYNVEEGKVVPPATVEFKVSKQWMVDNGVDRATIALYRRSGNSWTALETAYSGEDSLYYYFRSSSPGLSLFAITGLPRTAFWDLISLIEAYYAGDPSVDFWKVLDALTAYYASGGSI